MEPNVSLPTNPALRNGIDLDALQATIDAVTADPAKAQTNWTIRSEWLGGTRSDHHVDGYSIGGEYVPRPFRISIDEPFELTGSNEFANPQEYLLSAMNACMIVGYAAVAGLMGIDLDSLEVETTGDIDLRGFLGISGEVPPGYPRLEQRVKIKSRASSEELAKLHETVQRTSPNFFNITQKVDVNSQLQTD